MSKLTASDYLQSQITVTSKNAKISVRGAAFITGVSHQALSKLLLNPAHALCQELAKEGINASQFAENGIPDVAFHELLVYYHNNKRVSDEVQANCSRFLKLLGRLGARVGLAELGGYKAAIASEPATNPSTLAQIPSDTPEKLQAVNDEVGNVKAAIKQLGERMVIGMQGYTFTARDLLKQKFPNERLLPGRISLIDLNVTDCPIKNHLLLLGIIDATFFEYFSEWYLKPGRIKNYRPSYSDQACLVPQFRTSRKQGVERRIVTGYEIGLLREFRNFQQFDELNPCNAVFDEFKIKLLPEPKDGSVTESKKRFEFEQDFVYPLSFVPKVTKEPLSALEWSVQDLAATIQPLLPPPPEAPKQIAPKISLGFD